MNFNRMKKRILSLCVFIFTTVSSFAQEPEMADALHESGKIYVVVAVLAIIFVGIVAYLVSIDRKLSKLEKQLKKEHNQNTHI